MSEKIVNNDIAKADRKGPATVLEYGPVIVSNVYRSKFQQKGTLTAELRQVVTTTSTYGTNRSMNNDLNDDIFASEAKELVYTNTSTRVCFLNVPDSKTKEDVQEALPETARLVRYVSNKPILTSQDEYAIRNDLRTYSQVADSQALRNKDLQLIPDNNGKVQFVRIAYSSVEKDDIDLRDPLVDQSLEFPNLWAEIQSNPAPRN